MLTVQLLCIMYVVWICELDMNAGPAYKYIYVMYKQIVTIVGEGRNWQPYFWNSITWEHIILQTILGNIIFYSSNS